MTNRDHATILDGYLSRLAISQRDRIIEADNGRREKLSFRRES